MNRLDRVFTASRIFCIAAILGMTAITTDLRALQGTFLLCIVAATAAAASVATRMPAAWVAVIEAFLATSVIGLMLPDGLPLLPYLVVPALIAGMARGLLPLACVITVEILTLALATGLTSDLSLWRETIDTLAPWLLTSMGIGLLGSWLRQIGRAPQGRVADASYESARRLLTQLRVVARRLSAGLDPVSMSSQIMAVVGDHLSPSQSAVFVSSDGGDLSPLGYTGSAAREEFLADSRVIDRCWTEMEPALSARATGVADRRHRVVLPLRVGSRMIGVVVADSRGPADPDALRSLMQELDDHSLRLDTAMAFDEVRSIATAEERRRLSREIHDGIAQEVASLGYTVDDLAAHAKDPAQAARLRKLRGDMSRLVSELRLSIFDLRSEVDPTAGLGSAVSDYVRMVGTRSKMTVHLTLDEAPTRLRADVETELLRITQEAITNARKHSSARNLWVDCRVQPPSARIEVRDDGVGMKAGRQDSYGVRIMRERAARIDASLEIGHRGDTPGSGTLVSVTLGAEPGTMDRTRDER